MKVAISPDRQETYAGDSAWRWLRGLDRRHARPMIWENYWSVGEADLNSASWNLLIQLVA